MCSEKYPLRLASLRVVGVVRVVLHCAPAWRGLEPELSTLEPLWPIRAIGESYGTAARKFAEVDLVAKLPILQTSWQRTYQQHGPRSIQPCFLVA